MVMVGLMAQRTHVQGERGYFGLRTDGQTKNIMPPVPKGGGIKNMSETLRIQSRLMAKLLCDSDLNWQ